MSLIQQTSRLRDICHNRPGENDKVVAELLQDASVFSTDQYIIGEIRETLKLLQKEYMHQHLSRYNGSQFSCLVYMLIYPLCTIYLTLFVKK